MKILITGGAGFIGSAVIRHIFKHTEHTMLNIDKLTYASNLQSIEDASNSSRYSFVQEDICNYAEIEKIVFAFQPDLIMHLAAESHVDRSINNANVFIQTNIIGTYNLLEISRAYWQTLDTNKKKLFRFHHISTDEVYGDLELDAHPFTEQTPYNPSSPYSASKASSDHLVRAWHRTYDLPVIISNCSNNYGYYQHPEKLIPRMILNALAGKALPVYGQGHQIRDWLFVEDHASALYLIATTGAIGETYNVGGDNQKRNIDVVNAICTILDEIKPNKTGNSYRTLITHVTDRPGHDVRYAIDATKLATKLGWSPKENFETGLRKTVDWYIHHLQLYPYAEESNHQPAGAAL